MRVVSPEAKVTAQVFKLYSTVFSPGSTKVQDMLCGIAASQPFDTLLKLLSKLCEFLFQVRDFILEPSDFVFQLFHSVAINGAFQSVRLDL